MYNEISYGIRNQMLKLIKISFNFLEKNVIIILKIHCDRFLDK